MNDTESALQGAAAKPPRELKCWKVFLEGGILKNSEKMLSLKGGILRIFSQTLFLKGGVFLEGGGILSEFPWCNMFSLI